MFRYAVVNLRKKLCVTGIIAVELLDTMGIVLRFREKLRCLNRRFTAILPTMA